MDVTSPAGLPSGTVTFLFTDIEGSTKLLRAVGTDAFERVLEEHTALLRPVFRSHGGQEIRSEGDSFFYVFPLASSAVEAAAAAQRAFAGHSWSTATPVRLRIGMHTGEGRPASAASGVDYVGLDVHRAARIAAAGHGGQTLVSETTRVLASSALPDDITLRDMGEHRLKDLERPEHVYQVDVAGVPGVFAPIEGLDRPLRLRAPQTPLVGREAELARARDLLRTTRLLTLTGPGGTGKTRLAVELANAVSEDFSGDVHFVPLAPVADPAHVPRTIAQSLAISMRPQDRPLDLLAEHLRGRDPLLILDNFEHLLDAAPVVSEVLEACPRVKVVATSRARLEISGEQELPVAPLRVPEADRSVPALEQCESVRLFVQRASSVRPDLRLTAQNARAIAEICERLDGLPLAIELAAARVDILPVEALAERLARHLPLPGHGPRDLPERQRTVDAAIAWSYALLDAPTQRLFSRFGVFSGGAGLAETEAVCREGTTDVLDTLATVVRHSLLRQQELDGQPRFSMYATIRDFALERLGDLQEADAVGRRHAIAYADLFETSKPALFGPNRSTVLVTLDREQNNLRAAFAWAATSSDVEIGLRLAAASWRYWQMRGGLAEGRAYAEAAVARGSGADPRLRIHALEALAGLAYWQADRTAQGLYEERLRLARSLGDRRLIAEATYDLGFIYTAIEAYPEPASPPVPTTGIELFHEALEAFDKLGDEGGAARVRVGLGAALQFRGDRASAMENIERAIPILRTQGDLFTLLLGLTGVARDAIRRGDHEGVRSVLAEVLRIQVGASDKSGIAVSLAAGALAAHVSGDDARALRLAGAASAQREAAGSAQIAYRVLARDFTLAGWDAGLIVDGPAEIAEREIWEQGRRMPLEQAIDEATHA